MDVNENRVLPRRSISEHLQRAAVRVHVHLQNNIPLTWLLFILIFCSVLSQIMIMMLGPSLIRDPATDHWVTFRRENKLWRAPVIVYQDSRFKGWHMPIYDNISDLRAFNFRDISSMRISKGVTVTLYSNTSWLGAEISIDHDISYLGDKWNDKPSSLALEFEPVTAHAVEFYRAGSSMGLSSHQCPRNVVCSPDATLDAVPGSVYIAASSLLRENLQGLVGCPVRNFLRPDGRMIFGMLSAKVYYVCDGNHFVLPAEAPGFYVKVPVPSVFRRVQVETLSTMPRIHQALSLLSTAECTALMEQARGKLLRAGRAPAPSNAQNDKAKSKWAWSASMCDKPCQNSPENSLLSVSVVTRVAEVLGLPHYLAEGLIVRRFEEGAGEEPLRHEWNALDDRMMNPDATPENVPDAQTVNRFVSVFIFLNDVEEGGHLFFPSFPNTPPAADPQGMEMTASIGGGEEKGKGVRGKREAEEQKWKDRKELNGIHVRPTAGNAVIMYNLIATGHMQGMTDPAARVAAAAVLRGEKWVAEVRFLNKLDDIDAWNKAAHENIEQSALGKSGMNWKPAKLKHGQAPHQDVAALMQMAQGRFPT